VSISEGAIKSAIQFIYLTIGRPDFYAFVATFSSMYHLFAVKKRMIGCSSRSGLEINILGWKLVVGAEFSFLLVRSTAVYPSLRNSPASGPSKCSCVQSRRGCVGLMGESHEWKWITKEETQATTDSSFDWSWFPLYLYSISMYIMYIAYVLVVSWGTTGGKHVVGSCSGEFSTTPWMIFGSPILGRTHKYT
jgi:hypothetical protein